MEHEKNLTWQATDVTRSVREEQLHQRACTIWFTGLSGSGKSTLANALEKKLAEEGKHTMLLDGDNIRMGLNQNLGFSDADRVENIRRIAEVSKLMNDAGLIVLTAFISPFTLDRRHARKIIGDSFIEVFVNTPLEECMRRDVKGLYAAAKAGRIQHFTGISSPYEAPEHPEITLDTSLRSLDDTVGELKKQLEKFL
jgi:bifunctional enzyme CysN/CysC